MLPYNEDEWDDEEEAEQQMQGFKGRQRLNWNKNNYPSQHHLREVAKELDTLIANLNNDQAFKDQHTYDTVAVGLQSDGNLVIGANIKERRKTDSRKPGTYIKTRTKGENNGDQYMQYNNYGINKELAKKIVKEVKKNSIYKNSDLGIQVIEEKVNPKYNTKLEKMTDKAKEHASKHAESKLQAHSKGKGEKLESVGISKPPCNGCHTDLSADQVSMSPSEPGNKKVTNRKPVEENDVTTVKEVNRNKQFEVKFQDATEVNHNISTSRKALVQNLTDNIKNSTRPGASVGLITGFSELVDTIENNKVDEFAYAEGFGAHAGSHPRYLFGEKIGECHSARASVLDARAGFGKLTSVGCSVLAAGAHAEFSLTNVEVGATATVVRADANLGPLNVGAGLSFDSNASVGANGVSCSVLGTGFSIGPRMGIRTPFFDLSVTLF